MKTEAVHRNNSAIPRRAVLLAAVGGALSSCVAPYSPGAPGYGYHPYPGEPQFGQVSPALTAVNLSSLPQTIGLEHSDRVARFTRLADMYGVTPPEIAQLQLATGQVPGFDHPIPVVRVVFDAKVFFNFDKDTIRPEALPILDVIAGNMRHDVPDANLLVLGHTDAIGTDTYNIDLSRRRAANVMQALIERGVAAGQLATVAVGKSQPIAPNTTEEGRARNRRVEFMISASQDANLKLVSRRRIVQEYLKTSVEDPRDVTITQHVEIFRPVVAIQPATLTTPELISPNSDVATGSVTAPVSPRPPQLAAPVQLRSAGEIELNKPVPLADIQFREPEKPDERALSEYDTATSHT